MTEVRRTATDEIARIRAVVDQTPLPDIVTGYDVELGEFDDEPAMWIKFHTDGQISPDKESAIARGNVLRVFKERVHHNLREIVGDRYPYFRFAATERMLSSSS